MNESEPSPVSEQIEHTKTECLYAKLCEREGNPRQFISGSVPFAQLINNLTTKEKYSYCVSSGVSGLCPDETLIRNSCILRRFCPQLVAAKSLKKYGTVSFNKAPVSFFWFIFFLCLQDTKKENEHKKKDLLIEDKYLKKLLVDVFLLFIFSFCLRSKKKK